MVKSEYCGVYCQMTHIKVWVRRLGIGKAYIFTFLDLILSHMIPTFECHIYLTMEHHIGTGWTRPIIVGSHDMSSIVGGVDMGAIGKIVSLTLDHGIVASIRAIKNHPERQLTLQWQLMPHSVELETIVDQIEQNMIDRLW